MTEKPKLPAEWDEDWQREVVQELVVCGLSYDHAYIAMTIVAKHRAKMYKLGCYEGFEKGIVAKAKEFEEQRERREALAELGFKFFS